MNEWRGSLTSLCFWKEPKYDPLRSYSCPLDTLVHWIEPTSPSASTSNTDIVVVVALLALAPLSLIFTLARAPGLQRTLTSKPKKKLNYNVWFQALHQSRELGTASRRNVRSEDARCLVGLQNNRRLPFFLHWNRAKHLRKKQCCSRSSPFIIFRFAYSWTSFSNRK